VPYVRTVKAKSGATAVQFVYLSRRGSRDIEHLGSAHDEAELEAMKAAARQRGSWSSTWALSLRAAGRCRSPSRGGAPAGRPGARLPGPGACGQWSPACARPVLACASTS